MFQMRHNKPFLILLIFFHVTTTNAWRSYTFQLTRIDINQDYELLNLTASLKGSQQRQSIDLVLDVRQELNKSFNLDVAIFKMEEDLYEPFMPNISSNLCSLYEKGTVSPHVKQLFLDIIQSSNLPKKCPISKNKYIVKNLVLNEEQFPAYIPDYKYRVDISLGRQGDTTGKKAFTVQAFLELDQSNGLNQFKLIG